MSGERFHNLKTKVENAVHSSRGKDVLLYLMFVCVAFVFWALLSLDSEIQRDYEVPFDLIDVPDSVTLIGKMPSHLSVTVQGKGSQLIRFSWGRMPQLKVRFDENVAQTNQFSLSHQKLDTRLREYFGQSVQIASVRPDSIRVEFTSSPGVKLPLRVNADVHPNLQCIISGLIEANVDSVLVYGVNGVPASLTEIETIPFSRSDLSDTIRVEVGLKPVPGLRIIPDRVTVTVPVEPLIAKTRSVPLDKVGLPENTGLITFPSRVTVNYLVPMSEYNTDFPIRAYVDYAHINPATQKARVMLSAQPSECYNVTVTPDSVEYIIERH